MDDQLLLWRSTCPRCGEHSIVRVTFGRAAPFLGETNEQRQLFVTGFDLPDGYTPREVACRSCGWFGLERRPRAGTTRQRRHRQRQATRRT